MSKGVILYVGNFELPDHGASANRVVSNAKLFNQLGYQTALLGVTRDASCSGIRQLRNDAGLLMYERTYPVSTAQWLRHMTSVGYLNEMLQLHRDIALVILYNMPYSALRAAKKACKGTNIRVAYDCTEWTDVTDGNAVKRFVKKRDERLIRSRLTDIADGLIVISSMMERQYGGRRPLVKLPPLVDTEDAIWHQEPVRHEGFEFCFAGIPDGQKESPDVIVRAFAKIRDNNTRLRMIGMDRGAFVGAYPSMTGVCEQCAESLIFMGRQSHTDTVRYILGCDCYVFVRPSDRRNNAGFPTKFAEGVTCGVPLLATNVSDIRSFAGKNVTILDRTDEQTFAAAMRKMKTHAVCGHIDNTFDFRNYRQDVSRWLEDVINMGRNTDGK